MPKPGDEPILMSRRDVLYGINTTLLALGAGSITPTSAYGAPTALSGGTYKVQLIENTWITMPDGAARGSHLVAGKCATSTPSRRFSIIARTFARFSHRTEDETRFPYYAAHGYACIRVDIRGSGNSAGRPLDEYVKQEQDDGVEIIKWIAAQPWCSGAVGHGRHFLERLQFTAGRRAPPTGAKGDHHALLNR